MPGERRRLPVGRPVAAVWIAVNTVWVYIVGRVAGGFIIGVFRDPRSDVADRIIAAAFVPPIGLAGIAAAGVLTMLWLIRLERALARRRRTP